MTHHYEGDDLIVRKLEVGSMENNVYVLECPHTHEGFLVDGVTSRTRSWPRPKGAPSWASFRPTGTPTTYKRCPS